MLVWLLFMDSFASILSPMCHTASFWIFFGMA
jgi:hypothetical protein